MIVMDKDCYKCGQNQVENLNDMFGFIICSSCKSKMGLFQDNTLKRYVKSFAESKKLDPDQPTFEEEISNRLAKVEKDYISKKIKLLYLLERLGQLK